VKIKLDEELSVLHKYTFGIAKEIGEAMGQNMINGSNPYGVKEAKILDKIETFIIVGNNDLYGDKPIRKLPHLEIYEPWIKSRATHPENNRIYIWDR
jgi:hypothetical protein